MVDRISAAKLKDILPLEYVEQSRYIESWYPFNELQVMHQLKLIKENLEGRDGVLIGAGVAAYTTEYSTEPNPDQKIAP